MASNSLDFLLNLRANTTGFDQGINGAKFAVSALVGAMSALGLGLGVKELAEAADSYATLSARIQQATKDGGNFEQAMSGVHQTALSTNSSLDATAGLFTKLNTVAKDMGKSQQFALDMTSTVTKAIQLGGGSAQASEAAVQQFIQAMQGGVLRGEEFNSIMENGYGLAEALAKGLGVTTGELRKMAENGELSAERVLAALAKQKAGVDAQYSEMPLTISNALQKIATSWQILIGEMDQANGASATVAKALSTIADNLDILKVFFDDVANGVGWFRNQLSEIDPSTIDAIRSALSQAYDTVKVLIANVAEFGTTVWSAFNSALDVISPVFAAFLSGGEDVSGLTTLMNVLRMAMAAVGDIAFSLNVGFKTLLAGIQFLSAGLYSLSAQVMGFIGLDALAQQVQNSSDKMFAQAEKNMSEVNKLTQDHKWSILETYNEIGKTQDEKNAERIANNAKTLADLKAQEAQHVADYKAISDERIKLQQQLVDARKSGDQSAIDAALAGLAELDKKEKAYQAESKKISDEKIKATQDWATAQVDAATKGGVALSDNTKKTIEAGVTAQGLAVEFDKTGKAIVKAIAEEAGDAIVSLETKMGQGRKAAAVFSIDLDKELNKVSSAFTEKSAALDNFSKNLEVLGVTGAQAADLVYQAWQKWLAEAKNPVEVNAAITKLQELAAQGKITGEQLQVGIALAKASAQDLSPELEAAREAGKALGIDIDKTANIMSQGFGQGSANLDTLKQKLEEAGIKGKEASDTLYQGWKAWLEKADSQVEIDAAKAKLKEFEAQGVFSTRQVENGMLALEIQTGKVGETTDEVTQAFKRLGIQTKEQLALQAKQALMDFEMVRNSGQATQADLQKAYQKTIDTAYASGDAARISAANSKAALLGLKVQVDETGKASVKSIDELNDSVDRVGRTARGSAADGFRELGRVAREEAQSTVDEWEAAMAKIDAERKVQSASSAKGLGQAMDDMAAKAKDYENRLIAAGMDSGQAKKKGQDALDSMSFAYSQALKTGSVTDFSTPILKKMEDTLKYWEGKKSGSGASMSVGANVPSIQAPTIESLKMPNVDTSPTDTVNYSFNFNGKNVNLTGDSSQKDLLNDFFNELEQAKKAM